jgi:DNA-binding GntR family transcriptional regulator
VVAKKEVLVKGVKVPPQDVRNYLRSNGDIYYVLCKRVVDGEAAYLEESFIPLEVVPDIDEVDICQTPFYEMMQQKAATKIQKVVQMIEISEMTGDAASILKSGSGSSMLMLHRLLVGSDGKPLAYTRLMGDGKKYKLQTEMIQIV